MRKRSETSIVRAEVPPPGRTFTEADFRAMVREAVEQQVSEALQQHGSDSTFQPWFQPREISNEIIRQQTVVQQNAWGWYFDEHGCLICGTREGGHHTLGMCAKCHSLILHRRQAIIRKHTLPLDQFDPPFRDTVRLARESLAISVPPSRDQRKKPPRFSAEAWNQNIELRELNKAANQRNETLPRELWDARRRKKLKA